MKKFYRNGGFLVLLACTLSYGCNSASQSNLIQGASPARTPEPRKETQQNSLPQSTIVGDVIWKGESSGLNIRWTTVDLYMQTATGVQGIWEPLVEKGFEDYEAISADDGTGEPLPVMDCDYERNFVVLSVVGTLVSFEDSYYVGCEREAHPSIDTRFTTIDLAKSGDLLYALGQDTPMMDVDLTSSGKIVKLTDYFAEVDILRALLADRVVQKALATLKITMQPQTIEELLTLFAPNNYELGDSWYELRPDFLTRFAFHHIEGDRVAVRIGLPPAYGFNRALHLQLGLLLPIPKEMREHLVLAAKRQEGFLMRDAKRIARDRATTFKFKTGKGVERRN